MKGHCSGDIQFINFSKTITTHFIFFKNLNIKGCFILIVRVAQVVVWRMLCRRPLLALADALPPSSCRLVIVSSGCFATLTCCPGGCFAALLVGDFMHPCIDFVFFAGSVVQSCLGFVGQSEFPPLLVLVVSCLVQLRSLPPDWWCSLTALIASIY